MAGAYLTEMARRTQAGLEGSFSEPQMLHVLADLFGAGVDTTLTTLRWLLLLLAAHPEAQARVHAELSCVVAARSGHRPQLGDVSVCPFTEAAIAEAQRLRSVVPVGIPHGALEVWTFK